MANSKTITSGELRERLAKLVKGPVLGATRASPRIGRPSPGKQPAPAS
jgi:hypothetical protein